MDGGGVLASSGPPARKLILSPEDSYYDLYTQASSAPQTPYKSEAGSLGYVPGPTATAACKDCCCCIGSWHVCRLAVMAQKGWQGLPGMRARRGVPSVPGSAGAQRGGSSGGTTMSCSDSSSSRSGLGWRPSTSGALSTCASRNMACFTRSECHVDQAQCCSQ